MPLEVNKVAGLVAVLGMKKVIETNFEQSRYRRKRRYMAADTGILLILPMDHGHGVPPDEALDAALQAAVSRVGNLFKYRDGIHVRGIELDRKINAGGACALGQRVQKSGSPAGTLFIDNL